MSMVAGSSLLIVQATKVVGDACLSLGLGHEIHFAKNNVEAISKLRRFEPGVVLIDNGGGEDLSNQAAFQLLQDILSLSPETKVIILADESDKKLASRAIHYGAHDYYEKPLESFALKITLERAFYLYSLEKERSTFSFKENFIKGIVTASPLMEKVCQTIHKVAPNNITILLLGESGTGKEILAKALHEYSDRSQGPFVAINCAAIPETLLESELFGYEKGAFTGAVKQTQGKIETAHKGTLFLDEIGDLPTSLQPKLLRFLQERVIDRLGGRTPIAVDVRVICATHQDLQELIVAHAFREDLYYRLSEVTISIPPLRDRIGDAALMARHFLAKFSLEYKRRIKRFSEEALEAIHQYSWPGNVRELENKIKRAVIMAEGSHISLSDLDLPLNQIQTFPFNLRQVRDTAEKEVISRAMHYCEGNVSKAAELLGVTRPTLYNLMEKLNVNEKSCH